MDTHRTAARESLQQALKSTSSDCGSYVFDIVPRDVSLTELVDDIRPNKGEGTNTTEDVSSMAFLTVCLFVI